MNPQALEEIRQNIETAGFLSESEKEIFFDILPSWPEGHLGELLAALGGKVLAVSKPAAEGLTEGARVEDLKKMLSQRTVSFKNVPTKPPVAPPVRPLPKKITVDDVLKPPPPVKTEPAGMSLEQLKKLQASLSPQAQTTPPPAKRSAPPRTGSLNIKDIQSSAEIGLLTLTDLKKGDFVENLQFLLNKFVEVARKEDVLPYTVISAFEKSPVNQLFVKTGLALMDDITLDRPAAFAKVQNRVNLEQGQAFDEKEFHAFTDFKSYLESLI